MPYKISKTKGGYKVTNKKTGKVKAKKTTLSKAKSQIRLLHSKENKK